MDRFPQMLYRAPGKERGASHETLIVHDDEQLEAALDDGWHETQDQASDALARYRAELAAEATREQEEAAKALADAAEQALKAPLLAEIADLQAKLKAEQEAHAATRAQHAAKGKKA